MATLTDPIILIDDVDNIFSVLGSEAYKMIPQFVFIDGMDIVEPTTTQSQESWSVS